MYLSKRTFILAASAILTAGAAFPQDAAQEPANQQAHHGKHGRMNSEYGQERLAKALSLTDEQKQQSKAIHEKYRASNQEIRTQMRDLRTKVDAAKQANNTTELDQLKQQRETVVAKWKETHQAQMAEFRQILTPDQQAKLDSMKQQHRENRQTDATDQK